MPLLPITLPPLEFPKPALIVPRRPSIERVAKLGMFQPGFRIPPGGATRTYEVSPTPGFGSATSFTFTSAALGTAKGTSLVIVVVHQWDTLGDTRHLTGVTVGGSAATQVVLITATNSTASDTGCAIFQIVTASTSANIVCSFSNTVVGCGIDVYRLNTLTSTTAFNTASHAGGASITSISTTINVPANGVLIHGCTAFSTAPTESITGSGSTQDHTQSVSGDGDLAEWVGSAQLLGAQTGRTISNTFGLTTGVSGSAAIVGATWN